MRKGHYRYLARREAKARRKALGIKERRQRMVRRVEPKLVLIPEWARKRAVRGLSTGADFIWLFPGDARLLERMDREAGGEPSVLETEFRRCKHCGRPALGADAAAMLGLDMGCQDWAPCGDECDAARADRRWRSLPHATPATGRRAYGAREEQ